MVISVTKGGTENAQIFKSTDFFDLMVISFSIFQLIPAGSWIRVDLKFEKQWEQRDFHK
jgi:hypothetical protein